MFRIGEFSRIAQVSGRLLRYYDNIGLLSPEATDPETGYRYYSAQQLPRLNRILVLKELGLSLEQIAHLLDQHTSVDEIRAMLAARKAQIEQSLQEEMQRLQAVETRLQQIDSSGQIQEPDVVLKSLPAQRFLAVRDVFAGLHAIRRFAHVIAQTIPPRVGSNNLAQLAFVIHSALFDPEAIDVEIGYLLTGNVPQEVRLSEDRVLTVHRLPAIHTMATLAHKGSTDTIHLTYGALGTWIERHGWQISGEGRHTLVHLSDEDDETIVEVQLPVKKVDHAFVFDRASTGNQPPDS
jgi:DNA-binding transcriptional MerR regulator